MPDKRKHRGPHPEDRRLFDEEQLPALRNANHDFSWLLSRNYAPHSAIKIVGDRYHLESRQRLAVLRCACTDQAVLTRQSKAITAAELSARVLWIDGYNVITSVEAALAGGVILMARDGCYRDMASMHGSYRRVEETAAAILSIGELLHSCNVAVCHWLLDQPVSNSGRLRAYLLEIANSQGWPWQVELVPDPDPILSRNEELVSSSDSQILDGCQQWFNLARDVIDTRVPDGWIVNLSPKETTKQHIGVKPQSGGSP